MLVRGLRGDGAGGAVTVFETEIRGEREGLNDTLIAGRGLHAEIAGAEIVFEREIRGERGGWGKGYAAGIIDDVEPPL